MSRQAFGYRVQVWRDDALVADSDRTVRDEEPGQAPQLWFPLEDLRVEPTASGITNDEAGSAGRYVGFDPEQFRVEILDMSDGDDPRACSIKRFPNWGDADDLIEMMDIWPDENGVCDSVARSDWRRPIVEASQVLGQCVVGAMRCADGRRVVSASLVAIRAADARYPLNFSFERLTHGRTFSTVLARVDQNGRQCATATLLLDATAPDVVRHEADAPIVAQPLDCPTHDMGVTGRDLRIVDGAYTSDPDAPVGPPVLDAWVRFRRVPDDPALNAGLLAQFTGHVSIGAALRAHAGVGERQAHVTLSTGINAISISFHRDVRADEWMLYHHESTFAGDGMTHSQCRVHDIDGHLLASFAVEAMVRGFAGGTSGDYRSSL